MKKIVVITGSPRRDGNSAAMTEAFVKAAEAKGHSVKRFDAANMKLGGCRACETCFSTGKACTFDDDFNAIAPDILEADAVVFSTPVYWYSWPSQIKCVIDKLYSFCVAGKPWPERTARSSPAARRRTRPCSTACASRSSARLRC